jgi:drug/metabolite transporter (DMT)-like permease
MKASGLPARLTGSRRQPIGLGASALAAIMWGFGGIFAVLTSAPGLVLTFYRLWLGAAMLAIVVCVSGRRLTRATMRGSFLGGVFLAGDMALFFSAVKYTSVVDVTVIGAFQPVLVHVAARRMFAERLGRWDFLWILLAMSGVSIAVLGPGVSSHHQAIGDLLAAGAMLCWSAYWLVSKRARKINDAMEYTAGVTITAAVIVTPIVLLSGQSLARVEAGDWLWIFLLTFAMGSAHVVMNWAHRYVEASVSSVMSCLSPLVAAVAAMIILGQPLTLLQATGVLLGLAAISVVAARHREPAESQLF